jgi:hypothetical protein
MVLFGDRWSVVAVVVAVELRLGVNNGGVNKNGGKHVAIKMWRKWREVLFGQERYGGRHLNLMKKDMAGRKISDFRHSNSSYHYQHNTNTARLTLRLGLGWNRRTAR